MKYVEFEVRSAPRRPFPLDMLRYDLCCPVKPEDVSSMSISLEYVDEPLTVRLRHYCESSTWEPTYDRWNSFGWTVVGVDTRRAR